MRGQERATARRRTSGTAVLVAAMAALAATLALLTPAPAAAGGEPGHGNGHGHGPQPEVLAVSGSFTATGQLATACAAFLRQVVDGGGDWAGLGAATFHLDFCIDPPSDGMNYPLTSGTFTVTSPDGTLSGSMGGHVQAGGSPPPEVGFPLHLELTVDAGTGRFDRATGTLVLDGAFGYAGATAWGTVSGTVTIPPPVADSEADCRHGGWRRHVDDQGRPFRNQGRCLAFVRHQP